MVIQGFKKENWLKDDFSFFGAIAFHTLSASDFMVYCSGVGVDRIEKTKALTRYPIACITLHPCHKSGKKNCTDPWC